MQNVKLLIVEDEPVNMQVLCRYLENAGYDMDTAEDGEAAWERLEANPAAYQIVVTDRLMPRLDGLELFERMKHHAALRHIPVIMQTAADSDEEVMEGVEAGIFYYLTKPYQEKMLLSVVEAAAEEHQHQQLVLEQTAKKQQAMGNCQSVAFSFRTLEEAQNIAFFLGSLFPEPQHKISGLFELMSNAVEHGNLGMDYATKSTLLDNGTYQAEISKRLGMEEYQAKMVNVSMEQRDQDYQVFITDQGDGFDWQPFMVLEPSRATDNHGRGIAKANLLSFDSVRYHGKGNQVECIIEKEAA